MPLDVAMNFQASGAGDSLTGVLTAGSPYGRHRNTYLEQTRDPQLGFP